MPDFSNKAKPCPFCAGDRIFAMCDIGFYREFFMCCISCGADGPRTKEGEVAALLKWNERK